MSQKPQSFMDPDGTDNTCASRPLHLLKPGSGIEFVNSCIVELIKNPPMPEAVMCEKGLTTIGCVLREVVPQMPLPQDRDDERVLHFLGHLKMRGRINICESDRFITLPIGEKE